MQGCMLTPEEMDARLRDHLSAIAPQPAKLLEEYNAALEARLLEVRTARGYTDRDPALYAGSSVPRWAQDAKDWTAYRDEVMLYGLDIMNEYESTGTAPCTLDEFKAHLADMECEWTYSMA